MIETANWLSRQFVRVMKSEQDPVAALEHTLSIEVPIITSRQRAMGIFKDGTCFWDSRWVKNNDFHHFSGNEFLQKLAQFVPEYPEKEALDADEIISRLLPKIEQSQSFVGIIDYNFTYTLIPVIVESHFYGHALVIFDKWDILQSSRLSKAFILFISIVSLVFGMLISLIYYKSFLIPLRKLVQESMDLQHTAKLTNTQFPVKSRSDEIGQLGLAFYNAASTLEEKRIALENFTADILHELKNPLSAIRNCAEILYQNQTENSKQRFIIEMLQKESGRIEKLLFEIKELSSFEKSAQRERSCIPVKVTEEVLELYSKYKIDVEISLSIETKIALSPEEWARIIKNLLDNAVDFSPELGSISLDLKQSDGMIQLLVSDKGPGFAKGEEIKIFRRFYSLRRTDNSLHSGLGLAIVKSLAESGDGKVCCENRPPEDESTGARFIVEMPIVP